MTKAQELTRLIRHAKEENPCARCNRYFKWPAMDFHHVYDEKVSNVSQMIKRGFSKREIELEIDKCVLVCACCHRIITAGLDTLD